jgi:hypothetical protein
MLISPKITSRKGAQMSEEHGAETPDAAIRAYIFAIGSLRRQSAESKSAICRRAFDLGITHFDLANNNEPQPGACYSVKTQAFSMDEKSRVGLVSGEGSNGPHGRRSNVSHLAMTAICAEQTAGVGRVEMWRGDVV